MRAKGNSSPWCGLKGPVPTCYDANIWSKLVGTGKGKGLRIQVICGLPVV